MELSLSNLEPEELGKIQTLRIVLPLFNATGKFKVPELISDSALREAIISSHIKPCREWWEEEDDDEIGGKLRTALIQLSFLDNVLPIGGPEHILIFKTMLVSSAGSASGVSDDVAKLSEEYEVDVGYKHFVKRQSLMEKILNQETTPDEELESIQLLFPAAAAPLAQLNAATREAQGQIPDLFKKVSQGNDEFVKRVSAAILALESDQWEEDTLDEIQSGSSTLGPILEIIAGLRNVRIQTAIRDSYLFQRLLNRFTIVSRALHNLINLKEDLENARVRENALLRLATTTGNSLQNQVEGKVVEMRSILKDMEVIAKKLEKTYPADENVFEYLEIIQQAWDAQLLCLPHLPQYQHLSAKLVEPSTEN